MSVATAKALSFAAAILACCATIGGCSRAESSVGKEVAAKKTDEAVTRLCARLRALPLRRADDKPALDVRQDRDCERNLLGMKEKGPRGFEKVALCADWAHDVVDFAWCLNQGKADDAGVFVPPAERP